MIDAAIARLVYMTHGNIGKDWRSGMWFVLNEKGDEFSALAEAADALRAARSRELDLSDALEKSRALLKLMMDDCAAPISRYENAIKLLMERKTC